MPVTAIPLSPELVSCATSSLGSSIGAPTIEPSSTRRRIAFGLVDGDSVGPLRADEEELATAEDADLEALRLAALVLGAALRVVADPDDLVLEARAGLPLDGAVFVEEGEAARAALLAALVLVVALVRGREGVVVDPGDRIGLAALHDRLGQLDETGLLGAELLLGRIDVLQRHTSSREVLDHRGRLEVDDHEVVVLLEADDGLVLGVDVDVLGLGIVRGDVGNTGEIDRLEGPASGLADELEHLEAPGGSCGISPSFASSSRSFSVTIAASRPSGEIATESG